MRVRRVNSSSAFNTRDAAIGYALVHGWITETEAQRQCDENLANQSRRDAVAALYRAAKNGRRHPSRGMMVAGKPVPLTIGDRTFYTTMYRDAE